MQPRRAPRAARVTTRTGDRGETSLFGKGRVRKTDPRIEALGDLDEAQAAIGSARSVARKASLRRDLLDLERHLYLAMAEVATPRERLERLTERIDAEAVRTLESALEAVKERTPIEGGFVLPGEDPLSSALHQARTVVRRAERRVVECVDAGLVSGDHLLPWLNRLSDLLFVLARSVERRSTASRR